MSRTGGSDWLTEIEQGALDTSSDLPSLLRKCISLGAATRSARLREWASRELKGYGPDDELPEYRCTKSLLFMDAALVGGIIKGQQVPLTLIPEEARPSIQGDIYLPQPVAELMEVISSALRRDEESVRLSPPLSHELLALMNHQLAQHDRGSFASSFGFGPSQVIERVYWLVPVSRFAAIIDTVRTTLIELVAEMRAGTPRGASLPTHEVAEQAVDIAIMGNRNRITISQVGPHGDGAAAGGGAATTGTAQPESTSRRRMWWIVSVATVIAAIATIALLLLA
jgi:hypothetical protein